MYHLKQQGNEIVKYSVDLNVVALGMLHERIRENCGEIIHKNYQGKKIHDDNAKYVRNLRKENLGSVESRPYKGEWLYAYDYDYISECKMCTMITELLNNDVSMIEQLQNYTPQKSQRLEYYENLDEEMRKIMNESIGNRDLDKMQTIIDEMRKYKRYLSDNANRKSEMDYKEKVLSYIQVTRVASMSTVDFILAYEFMQDISSSDIKDFEKVKK